MYEFFAFEVKYRLKRPETYLFFLILFGFSIFGVEFVFQGIELGLVKKNSPLVIGKSMGAITGLSLIIASMIMGVPVLRDFQYDIASILYVKPISKLNYLMGRFLGSFFVLLLVFSSVLFGMILGEFMPWMNQDELMPFQIMNYLQPFVWVALPILSFGASVFFTAGALSKSLLVVYTQGLFIFVLFMISQSIPDESLQALLDPFSLATLTKVAENWTINERNFNLIPINGLFIFNKLFWVATGLLALGIGYSKFQLLALSEKKSNTKPIQKIETESGYSNKILPLVYPVYHLKAQFIQLVLGAWFHSMSILKLISFWAIILCGFVILMINSISLGTSYGVDSYPTTYLIIEEIKEMIIYFLMIILIFYSAEIMWKEKDAKLDSIYDTLPFNSFVNVSSRFLGLMIIYTIILFSLIVAGVIFQTFKGYYKYELDVYFLGFFLELFPFLALYTFAAFLFQSLTRNKFVGMLATITFAIANGALSLFGFDHVLLNFGGQSLPSYSQMNGYGHSIPGYLWVKLHWLLFGILLLILSSLLKAKGIETGLRQRWKRGVNQLGKPLKAASVVILSLLLSTGCYIFYNTNILNDNWTKNVQNGFRADYEKTLKKFEYTQQPKIIDANLKIDLFPSKRTYEISGYYILKNTSKEPIYQIHVQKRIASNVELTDVDFDRKVTADHEYEKYDYVIYELSLPLAHGDSLKMNFRQTLHPKGFEVDGSNSDVIFNGTFFDNSTLPSFGYQKKYELQDEDAREEFELSPLLRKASQDDVNELVNARSGSDSDGLILEIIISTEAPQTALTSGNLVAKWQENGRNYFHFKTDQRIINFYPILSAQYELMQDKGLLLGNQKEDSVDLEIYYQKGHEYNLDRMMESMKMSLDYYSSNFGPYPYDHLRIVEFPRYQSFAQSLPGIIPFSEDIGFVMDIRDDKDVDMAFYVTAHEVAHQWWGMQLEAANVKGQHMILETLAQYSAMMVFKEKYSRQKVDQFLKIQLDTYLKESLKSKKEEIPLTLVENESHIYYNKGALAMYELYELIGEEKINLALQNFLNDWHSFDNPTKPNRYPTSVDLIQYFREVTPDSLQYVIKDWFEQIYCP